MTNVPDSKQRKIKDESARLDDRGRLSVPVSIRKALGLESGDMLFMRVYGSRLIIEKAINPFDVLVDEALKEYRAGKTKDLESFARELGIDLEE